MNRITPNEIKDNVAMADLAVLLHKYKVDHDLTINQMFMAVTTWMQTVIKHDRRK